MIQKRYFETNFNISEEDERIVEFSFSSDAEINRGFYYEILSHDKNAIDTSRLLAGAPLLYNHDPDKQIGVVLSSEIRGTKAYARCKFSSNPFAAEIYKDVIEGIRRGISVGYSVDDVAESGESGGLPRILVTRWQPLELSVVSLPADISVGFGRSVDYVKEVFSVGSHFKKTKEAYLAIKDNISLKDFKRSIISEINEEKKEPRMAIDVSQTIKPHEEKPSIVKIIRSAASGDWSNSQNERDFLLASEKVFNRDNRSQGQIHLPNIFFRNERTPKNFDELKSGWKDAAFIARDPTGIIDIIEDKSIIGSLGIQRMPGLESPVDFLHAKTNTYPDDEAFWVGDNQNVLESSADFYSTRFDMLTLGTYVDIPRRLLEQDTYGVQKYLQNMILKKVARGIEHGFFYGSYDENPPAHRDYKTMFTPEGLYTFLIKSRNNQRYDKDGVPIGFGQIDRFMRVRESEISWQTIVDMETNIATENADVPSMSYVTNSKIRGLLKGRVKSQSTDTYLWNNGMNGYKAYVSNMIGKVKRPTQGKPAIKRNHIIFGDWSQAILGEWSGFKILINPYTMDLQGAIRIKVEKSVNFHFENAESFVVLEIDPDEADQRTQPKKNNQQPAT